MLTTPPVEPAERRFSPASRRLIVAAALVVVIAGLRAAAEIVVPTLFALFLAIIVAPALGWLRRRGVPTVLAYTIVAAAVVVVGVAVIVVVGTSLSDFVARLPEYQIKLQRVERDALHWLEQFGLDLKPRLQSRPEFLDTDRLVQLMGVLASGVASAFADAFLILITTVFMLAEAAAIPAKLRALPGDSEEKLARLGRIVGGVRRYMVIKTWASLITGVGVTLILYALRVPYPPLWGLLMFLLNFVPNIGSILAAIPPIVVALLDRGPGVAALATVGYLAVNNVIGYVIEPRWLGRGLGLSALAVLLSLIVWGWALGPPGMLLSVPLTMAVKVALEHAPDTRWIATLLGEMPEPEPPADLKATGPTTDPLA